MNSFIKNIEMMHTVTLWGVKENNDDRTVLPGVLCSQLGHYSS